MRIKVLGAMEAIDQGVGQVIFGDARIAQPVTPGAGRQGTVIGSAHSARHLDSNETSCELEQQYTSGCLLQARRRHRARRGRAPVGRPGQRVHRLRGRAWRGHRRPLQPRRGGGHLRTRPSTLITCPEIFYNDVRARLLERLVRLAPEGLERVPAVQLGHRGGRGGAQAGAPQHRDAPASSPPCAAFTAAPWARCRPPGSRHYREPFEPLVPGFSHVPYGNLDAHARGGRRRTPPP